jgi:hypothetical protein
LSSQPETIRAAITVLIESATGVVAATAHPRTRRPVGDAVANTRAALFQSGGIVNTWEVAELDATSEWAAVNVAWTWNTRFIVRGWYEHDDANNSEDAFRTIVQAVTRAINADLTLGGTVTRHDSVQIARLDMEAKAGAVCHVAELELVAEWTEKP